MLQGLGLFAFQGFGSRFGAVRCEGAGFVSTLSCIFSESEALRLLR